MRPNETVFQYLVAIRELANRGQGFLDETSIMEYCINGIPDSAPSNKLILYGCTTIQEFKEKLGIYDKIFQNKSKNHSYDTSRSPNFSSQRRDVESTLLNIEMIDIQNSMHQSLIQNLRIKISEIGIT
ncbi:hypothetical protein TNCV_3029261 [Trichonephila clavipes]|nr:hypothetical protein TNCV_3029261 [Trichonephila clavipes]